MGERDAAFNWRSMSVGTVALASKIELRLGLTSRYEALQPLSSRPNPFPQLGRHSAMLLAIDLASERGTLQRPGAQIERERDERIELAVSERHMGEA